MKNAHDIIIKPHITEKTVFLSQGGDPYGVEETLTRKYTFVVDPDANKIEIAKAIEEIYNAGTKKGEKKVNVTKVHVISMKGKTKRIGFGRKKGQKKDWKKAIVTLREGDEIAAFETT